MYDSLSDFKKTLLCPMTSFNLCIWARWWAYFDLKKKKLRQTRLDVLLLSHLHLGVPFSQGFYSQYKVSLTKGWKPRKKLAYFSDVSHTIWVQSTIGREKTRGLKTTNFLRQPIKMCILSSTLPRNCHGHSDSWTKPGEALWTVGDHLKICKGWLRPHPGK